MKAGEPLGNGSSPRTRCSRYRLGVSWHFVGPGDHLSDSLLSGVRSCDPVGLP
jgi:hypothetical protein